MTETERQERPIIVSTVHWYVVVCEPGMHNRVASDLGKQGFDIFTAMILERRWKGNKAWIEVTEFPLAPYVFVGIDDAFPTKLNLKMVADTLGVSGVVSLTPDGSPSKIHPEIIRRMRADIATDLDRATRRVRRDESAFKAGDEVELRPETPFAGYRGKVSLKNGRLYLELPNGLPLRVEEDELIPVAWAKRRVA